MMYAELYQYLLQHKELPVPGIGTFLLERKPADVDFPNKKVNPPAYSFALQAGSYVPGQSFFSWLAAALGVSDREAVFRFNDFAFDMKKQVSDGAIINWDGVGVLNKGLAGDVRFTPAPAIVAGTAVMAEKVIRIKAEHMVRVGEDERTSAEMEEMLAPKEEKKSYWWAYALGLIVLALMFIGWYLSEHGVALTSTANGQRLSLPEQGSPSYKQLP